MQLLAPTLHVCAKKMHAYHGDVSFAICAMAHGIPITRHDGMVSTRLAAGGWRLAARVLRGTLSCAGC